MNPVITRFLKKQTCSTVCCIDEMGAPYCFNCFYVFDEEAGALYLKSSPGSRHAALLMKKQVVAGTILPDKLSMLAVKGVQFEGIVPMGDAPEMQQASAQYYKKYPLALAIPGEIWVIRVNYIKMTDSTLGFGKKIIWERVEQEELPVSNVNRGRKVLV